MGRHAAPTPTRQWASRAPIVAAPLAVATTMSTVSLGVMATGTDLDATVMNADLSAAGPIDRGVPVSRSGSRMSVASADQMAAEKQAALRLDRESMAASQSAKAEVAATAVAVANADVHEWSTTELNIWSTSGSDAAQVGTLESGKKVLITGRNRDGRDEIVIDDQSRWVTEGYLSDEKPATTLGLSSAPCPDGSVESGLTSNAVSVYRSVCHAFPQITSYGGWDGHGEHASGRAIDIMVSDPVLGQQIADYLVAHSSELNLYDVIWQQHIWTPVRSSEGWRYMSDRGSATANHYDHVHVSTY